MIGSTGSFPFRLGPFSPGVSLENNETQKLGGNPDPFWLKHPLFCLAQGDSVLPQRLLDLIEAEPQ